MKLTATGKCIILLAAVSFASQSPDQPLRVTVNLVQIDAVVTDKSGRQVTNLTKSDFELVEDGKPRQITHFSYVNVASPITSGGPATRLPGTAPALKREEVRRSIALVVDDLRMSFESIGATRDTLRTLVDRQLQPGDLAAIFTTSGLNGPLAQFTTDRRHLHAAINRLRFSLASGGQGGLQPLGSTAGDADPQIALLRQRNFNVGTLGATRFIARGMRDLPGRKSLVLFSDGFVISKNAKQEDPAVTTSQVRGVADQANRSSVVIYAVDPRGLVFPGLTAPDDVGNLATAEVVEALAERKALLRDTQQGLDFLATETGGRAHFDTNGLTQSMDRILADQSGYYLLGYTRSGDDKPPRRVTLKVKTPGLQVRYRKGFMGDDGSLPELKTASNSPAARLLGALNSPFAGDQLKLRFTPTFTVGDQGQLRVNALLHIEAKDIGFAPAGADGLRVAQIHIIAMAQGENGTTAGQSSRSYTVKVREDALESQRAGGFVYALEHDLPRPGAYQLRVAVLDQESGRVGSANQFIDIPDVARGKFTISGITMRSGDLRAAQATENDLSPATRIFARDQPFSYLVTVYNAPVDAKTNQPRVELQPRLIAGGKVLWEGKRIPVVMLPGNPPTRLPAGGTITLSSKTTPGDYILEVQALSTDGKVAAIAQWTDFELR